MINNRTVGVICEYNPFHSGHKYQIDCIKEGGAGCIIGIMSGNFTQRGEPAIISKYERAKAAVLCGVDIVVELPFPFCCSYAEAFARGGVCVASRLLCDELNFGSECGSIDKLSHFADISASSEFTERLEGLDNRSRSTSYYQLLEDVCGGNERIAPNDILAVNYISAIKELNVPILPVTIKRAGDGYNDERILSEEFPSALSIRNLLNTGADVSKYMPREAWEVLEANSDKTASFSRLERVILSHFRLAPASLHEGIADMPQGLPERIRQCALRSSGADEMISMLNDVSLTRARIRRILLFCLCGVKKEDLDCHSVSYVNLLAANANGRQYLSKHRKELNGFVVTKPADAARASDILQNARKRQFELCMASDSLYSLSTEKVSSSVDMVKKSPYML